MRLAQRVAEDGVGMPAAYSVIAAVQESLTEREDELRTLLRDVRMKKYRDEEEELRKKLEGTTVTVENFLAWKQAFDEEQALANGASAKAIAKDSVQRLTGKALFLQDGGAMMITSDELFFEGGELMPPTLWGGGNFGERFSFCLLQCSRRAWWGGCPLENSGSRNLKRIRGPYDIRLCTAR